MTGYPISPATQRAIDRCRAKLEAEGLMIEASEPLVWRVFSPSNDRSLLYFPLEDRWRDGSRWGRGTVSLAARLKEEP